VAARKSSTTEPVDEAQNIEDTEPTEEEVLNAAQAMRLEYHAERGRNAEDIKSWDDLPEHKQQRWLDKVTGQGD